MAYLVTGATGFIGRHLLAALAARGNPVYILVRDPCGARLERALEGCGTRRELVRPLIGDLTRSALGLSASVQDELRGRIQHFFHLGALYDLAADAPALERVNVLGTRHALELAASLGCNCFHLVSSIAVAGRFPGRFTEDMFTEAVSLEQPYLRSKHESEALVRASTGIAWRIYRPGMVVGHSQSGVMDKIDGPYYLFKLIQQLRDLLPRRLSLPGFRGGYINLVPVDFVATALDYLAHVPDLDGRCFHLTAPEDCHIGEALNTFARAAHAPEMDLHNGAPWFEVLTAALPTLREALEPACAVLEQLLVDLDIPRDAVALLDYPTRFDSTASQRLLVPAAIAPPPLEQYAWKLWDFWERHLDRPPNAIERLRRRVSGKKVLVTGGSSGIGRAAALKLAAAGACVLIVARDAARLAEVRAQIESQGGTATIYCCDLADHEACARFVRQLLSEHRHVDILINNAGRSIRRAVDQAFDRLHDYERLMRINYLAAVQLTLAVLPGMIAHGGGQVINVSSIGVLSNAPRFTAYNASKAALEAFSRSAAAEFKERGVQFSVINMPLVRTPMVAPTQLYAQLKLLEPEQAAERICDAIVRRPARVTSGMGLLSLAVELVAPDVARAIMSQSFRLFADTPLERPDATATPISARMHALAALLHGVHV
jgi:NAD(P)-dependent dehydrogenase (short-subunit alcohol dehydrogenase family)